MESKAADYRHFDNPGRPCRVGLSTWELGFERHGDFILQFGQIKALYNIEVGRNRFHVFFEPESVSL